MSADSEQLHSEVDALLAELPEPGAGGYPGGADVDLDEVASCLEAAHDVLVRALESVEKG